MKYYTAFIVHCARCSMTTCNDECFVNFYHRNVQLDEVE